MPVATWGHVNQTKCWFLQPSVTFLGHCIDVEGINPTDDKLKAITQAPIPKNVQELRSFLGLINYYRKFVPNAATILAPLNDLLCKDADWKWLSKCQESFDLAKKTPKFLCTTTLICLSVWQEMPQRMVSEP